MVRHLFYDFPTGKVFAFLCLMSLKPAVHHEAYMRRCLQLAQSGSGFTAPNPMVGAVLVHNDRIIGEGWHKQIGTAHAEVNAVANVPDIDRHLISQSTLYVNLEPCNHHGKTPPCTDLILRERIPNVVIGSVDDNPLVGGKGIARLKEAGVEVLSGVLEDECRYLNRKFFVSHQEQRPFVTLKWAQTLDGFLSMEDGRPVNITTAVTQRLTHRLRAEHMAILTGWRTIETDVPQLNNRYWIGGSPQVVVLDLNGHLNDHPHLQNHPEWWRWVRSDVAFRDNDLIAEGIDLENLMALLYSRNIQSILVEGGAATLRSFIDAGCWDECFVYTGKITIENGLRAPRAAGVLTDSYHLGTDLIQRYRNL